MVNKKGNFEKKVLFFTFSLIALILLWAVFSQRYQSSKEKLFYNKLVAAFGEGITEVKLSSLTDFDWDNVIIVIQPDDSWDEGPAAEIAKASGLKYSLADDIHFPRFMRDYESAFIFSKQGAVKNIYRLNTKGIKIGNDVFIFKGITEGDRETFMIKNDRRPQKRFGIINFC
jgi:hypothetical protein